MDDKEYLEAVKMIDRIYNQLYTKYEVTHYAENKYNKFENIKIFIDRIEKIHNRAKNNPHLINQLKNYYYYKYVIKPEEIPESYYLHQQQLAFERGYGKIEITDYIKKKYQQQIIEDQKKSLDAWLDYFLSDDSNYIPMWAKFWAFQGMLKLGSYDKEKASFNKRSKSTTSIFLDLNREALALSIDYIRKYLNKNEIDDKDLEKLLKDGSFGKIYGYFLKKIEESKKNKIDSNEGIWVKYNKGSDHMPLVKSLQGYNTGWCTAGESTALSQLSRGDFYVYYTKDENGEYKVPRIAIRMQGNQIGEIRGVAPDQNLETNMEKVVEEKIKDFPDKDKYNKKVNDMRILTIIYKKNQKKEPLSIDELVFLYEIKEKIIGFGWHEDPRIKEIKDNRNYYDDLTTILGYQRNQVAFNIEELVKNRDSVVLYVGNLVIPSNKYRFPCLKRVIGSLYARTLKSADIFGSIEKIEGNAFLDSLIDAHGLENLTSIGGDAHFEKLSDTEGLNNLQSIHFSAHFCSLPTLDGLNVKVVGKIYINSNASKSDNKQISYSDELFDKKVQGIDLYQDFNGRINYLLEKIQKVDMVNNNILNNLIQQYGIVNIYSNLLLKSFVNYSQDDFNIYEFLTDIFQKEINESIFTNNYYLSLILKLEKNFISIILKRNCPFLNEENFDNIFANEIRNITEKINQLKNSKQLSVLDGDYYLIKDYENLVNIFNHNKGLTLKGLLKSLNYDKYLDLFANATFKIIMNKSNLNDTHFYNLLKTMIKNPNWHNTPESLQYDIMRKLVEFAASKGIEIDMEKLIRINESSSKKRKN